MSVISFSRLWSRMIVGAKTTARFFGDIYLNVSNEFNIQGVEATYQIFRLSSCYTGKMEHEEFEAVAMFGGKHVKRLPQVVAALAVVLNHCLSSD